MIAIEDGFPPLKDVLPKDYGIFEPKVLEDLMRLFNSEQIKQATGDVTVEETFARLITLANSLDAEQRRAVEEGLSDDELALFDLLFRENISRADRERVKQASRSLLASLRELLRPMPSWPQNSTTQAEVKVSILDSLWQSLPRPPFTEPETEALAERVYDYVWQRSIAGPSLIAA